MVTRKRLAPKIPPNGSTSADFGSTLGGLRVRGIILSPRNTTNRKIGKRTTAPARVGRASQAEYWRKLSPNAEVRMRFVGFDETSSAETRLDTWKWVKRYAVGGSTFAWRVK